jgi:hypothetical protein
MKIILMKMNQTTSLYLDALTKKYEAQKSESLANLNLYLSSSNLAAIGEHSDLLAEHDRWIDQYATASDKLETLEKISKKLGIKNKK